MAGNSVPPRRTRRAPENSLVFKWVIPAVFVLFGLLLIVILIVSVGVLAGMVSFH